ncbi:MAG TPA: chemotaxis protein CheW [Nitrospirota bacterium]|nr:chemotaxis protein CheW [Nitrospirota bacterium]
MADAGIMETTQFLTFKLGDEVFALNITKIREVLDFIPVTKVPRTPEFMRGVSNLRGNVVPVVDLRLMLGLSKTERTINTCIIITEVTVDDETSVLGVLADAVQEVLDFEADRIEPAPRIGMRLNTEFIRGIAMRDNSFIIILEIDRIFSTEQFSMVRAVQDQEKRNAAKTV